ncbi:MAG: Rrf2 family transcriptional regulator [Proteobacteria bacterium]|nr:Rrf2 family transcriptional regulator [Pseudomonadota bacterium]
MKISSRARHAVRLMLEVARLSDGQTPVQLSEVAKITGLSRRFLEQLAIALKSHSLLRGVCGRNGGYLLSRPSKEITIGNVLGAVTGPIQLSVCADDPAICMSSEFCSSRMVWALLQKRINQILSDYTIADLLDNKWIRQIHTELELSSQKPETESYVTASS